MRYVGPREVVIDNAPTPTPHWAPTRDFEEQTVAVIGGGPSLGTFDLSALCGKRFIVVNSGCRRLGKVATKDDILYFTDNSWSENRPGLVEKWPGIVVVANRHTKARLGDKVRYIDVTALTARMGVRPDYAQASSAHIGACLAADMGASKICLIGVECCSVSGRTHGHGDYVTQDTFLFESRFIPGWNGLAPAFTRLGVDVVNCTPDSAVTCFRFGELVEEMA